MAEAGCNESPRAETTGSVAHRSLHELFGALGFASDVPWRGDIWGRGRVCLICAGLEVGAGDAAGGGSVRDGEGQGVVPRPSALPPW
jgi:hypothetical protein